LPKSKNCNSNAKARPLFKGNINGLSDRARAWSDSLFVDHAIFRLAWHNWAEVIPGRLYRCNHPTPAALARAVKRFGLKTLVNLRGRRQCGSDALSREAAANLGLGHIDMAFESRGAPHKDRILRFYDIYQNLQFPALMHCKSGADRAGLGAGLALLFEGHSAADALAQLSWRHLHSSKARTGILDAFFLRYQAEAEGRIGFVDWVRHEYDEEKLLRDFKADGLASFITDKVLRRE